MWLILHITHIRIYKFYDNFYHAMRNGQATWSIPFNGARQLLGKLKGSASL